MRFRNEIHPSHRLSMKLDDGKGPFRVSSRLNYGLPRNKNLFSNLKERLEFQRDRGLYIDTEDQQFITFLKYGICRDCNEWSPPGSNGEN